jgi:hypothetical protein
MIDYIPDGTTFGLLDNGIVLVGMYLGVDIEGWLARKLDKESDPLLGAVVGATSFNMFSDGIAAAVDPSMQGMTFGIVLGCALVMLAIPFVERLRKKKKNT